MHVSIFFIIRRFLYGNSEFFRRRFLRARRFCRRFSQIWKIRSPRMGTRDESPNARPAGAPRGVRGIFESRVLLAQSQSAFGRFRLSFWKRIFLARKGGGATCKRWRGLPRRVPRVPVRIYARVSVYENHAYRANRDRRSAQRNRAITADGARCWGCRRFLQCRTSRI